LTAIAAEERRLALSVAAAVTLTTLGVAAAVRVGWAAEMRALLGFGFAGVSARPSTATSIFANNALLLAAVFAAILIAQSPWLAGAGTAPRAERGPVGGVLLAAVDTVLALGVAVNTALVGAALGAYGARMGVAMLPHGPLELAAYAIALALYLQARRGPLTVGPVAATATTCLSLLAVGSVLETFVAL
jgi:hypothetical protein